MVELNKMEYKQYKNLYPHEYEAISEFYNGGNKDPLVKLLTLESTIPLSHGIKLFIADVIVGKVKPNRSNKHERDYSLYKEVCDQFDSNPSLKLTSNNNKNGEGAAAKVASKHNGMSEEVVLEAYRKYNNVEKEVKHNY